MRAKSKNCEMVTIVEMFVFKYDIFATITVVAYLNFYALGAYAKAGIRNRNRNHNRNCNRGKLGNTESSSAVKSFSTYKIASHLLSAFEILLGHCQTGKLN